jgi:hypothetical protein
VGRHSSKRTGEDLSDDSDAGLARSPGLQYRYTVLLAEPKQAGELFQILEDLRIPLCYILVIPGHLPRNYRAHIGLASAEVFDFPLRMAARGIRIQRGEQMNG